MAPVLCLLAAILVPTPKPTNPSPPTRGHHGSFRVTHIQHSTWGILHAVGSNRRLACDRPLVTSLSRGIHPLGGAAVAAPACTAAAFSQEIFRDTQYPYAISTMASFYPSAITHATVPIASHALSGAPFYPSSLALVSLPFVFPLSPYPRDMNPPEPGGADGIHAYSKST
ncbi:hypothetical protein CORC01_13462 [Colletotrichum orchidophilum]|uniref:Uncharacterized protein n=1 Tax=Colletotrichum orchidophilum TaxID=1209926 RepID=A0A1G4AQ64_9PEZI|nr:uncharacterized protein CORC01_13462 [Colletotrichum orchidophilum]OHE91223.1 hypothetical protein CORC01_13462 [Colletotrichum orchidophilum]